MTKSNYNELEKVYSIDQFATPDVRKVVKDTLENKIVPAIYCKGS